MHFGIKISVMIYIDDLDHVTIFDYKHLSPIFNDNNEEKINAESANVNT